jgi:hypothetical protein
LEKKGWKKIETLVRETAVTWGEEYDIEEWKQLILSAEVRFNLIFRNFFLLSIGKSSNPKVLQIQIYAEI